MSIAEIPVCQFYAVELLMLLYIPKTLRTLPQDHLYKFLFLFFICFLACLMLRMEPEAFKQIRKNKDMLYLISFFFLD